MISSSIAYASLGGSQHQNSPLTFLPVPTELNIPFFGLYLCFSFNPINIPLSKKFNRHPLTESIQQLFPKESNPRRLPFQTHPLNFIRRSPKHIISSSINSICFSFYMKYSKNVHTNSSRNSIPKSSLSKYFPNIILSLSGKYNE